MTVVDRDPFETEASRREVYHRLKAIEETQAVLRAVDRERRETIDRRFDDVDRQMREQREEARAEHREQTETVEKMGDKLGGAIAALAVKVDAGAIDTAAERIKGRNAIIATGTVAIVGLAGSLIAKVLGLV